MTAEALTTLAADELDYELKRTHARQLELLFADRSEEILRGVVALLHLGSAIGMDLTFNRALAKLTASDFIYELAADRLLEPVRRYKQHVFTTEYERLEQAFFGNEAKARHAVFIGEIMSGRLGYQASMLLRAAEDAGLRNPDAVRYKAKIVSILGEAIEDRYPVGRDVEVVDSDSAHAAIAEQRDRAEQRARDLVLSRRPELAQRIDALGSGTCRRGIEGVLKQIRRRLNQRADEGWIARPEAYEIEVIDAAADAVRRAA